MEEEAEERARPKTQGRKRVKWWREAESSPCISERQKNQATKERATPVYPLNIAFTVVVVVGTVLAVVVAGRRGRVTVYKSRCSS